MNTRHWFRLLGTALVVVAAVAGCSTAASVAPSTAPQASTAPLPSPAPPSTAPAASTAANASPTAPPALTKTFVSPMHGISVGYPEGWTTRAATEKWTTSDWSFDQPAVDVIYDPLLDEGHLFMAFGSQPLGATKADKWIADQLAKNECTAAEPVTVDGASGSTCADGGLALVSTGERGYLIKLYTSGDEPWLAMYDKAWFDEVLSTVRLGP
jgi:hypothetical protein